MKFDKPTMFSHDTPMSRNRLRLITGDVTIFNCTEGFVVISFDSKGEQTTKVKRSTKELNEYITSILGEVI